MFDRLDCETIKVLIASFGICKLYGGAKVQKPIALLYCNRTCNVALLEERKSYRAKIFQFVGKGYF